MSGTQPSITAALALSAFLAAPGCALHQKHVLQSVEHPQAVNCATAEGDIRVLKGEKANVAEEIAEGVTAIAPAGIVLGILTTTEPTKIKVAIGDYNKQIEKRIQQIQETCGIQ